MWHFLTHTVVFSETYLAAEMAERGTGITVNAYAPGLIHTPMGREKTNYD